MVADPKREAALYQAAAQLSGMGRAAFLEVVCRGEPTLRERLEARFSTPDPIQGVLVGTTSDSKANGLRHQS
jgi:hypothetical protein